MPRRNARNSNSNKKFKMVNVDFNDQEKSEVNSWIETRETDIHEHLLKIAESGYKFSLSYSDYYECFTASITPQKLPKTVIETPVYIIRHADFEKVLRVAEYFFTVMMSDGESLYQPELSDNDW